MRSQAVRWLIDSMEEGTVAVKHGPHQTALLPIEIFDTAFGFGELFMVAGLLGFVGKEQRTAEALGAVAFGVAEEEGGMHA